MRRVIPAVLSTFLAGFLLVGPPAAAAPAASAAAEPAAPASTFTPLSPVRVLDTRFGTGGVTGPVGGGGTITLSLTARVPTTATAVVLNVTGVDATAATHVIVYPAGITRPTTSSLNLPPGDTRSNQVTVTLGTNRAVSLYNNAGSTHLVADLAGYYSTGDGARFTPLPPNRVLDTRSDGGPVGGGGSRVVDFTGRIPASATAVTFNLTATDPTGATFVTAFPTGTSLPNASNVNTPADDTRPNLVTVAVGTGRKVTLYNNFGSVDLIVDVTGFYTPDYGNYFVPFNPKRVLDTRNGTGTGGSTNPVGPGGYLLLDLAGELPLTATGVALNVTGVAATAPTFVTTWADVGEVPNASTLNLSPGQIAPNAAVVAFSQTRAVGLYNNDGDVHLVADLAGAFVVVDTVPCTTDCVRGWGYNIDRRLGTGEAVDGSSTPKPVAGLSGVRAVDGGNANTYALRADGTVWSWGNNQYGQLGNGWTSSWGYGGSATPVPAVGLTGVTAIAAGSESAYALRSDGTVWSWGNNFSGQLGNGNITDSSVPVRVGNLTNVVAITAGESNGYALRADGTLFAWGANGGGQLGNGSGVDLLAVPVVVALTNVTKVAAGGDATYALRADGTVWSWGYNFFGTLGNGQSCVANEPCLSPVPVQVSGLTGVTALDSSYGNGRALLDDGTVWSWGTNSGGALGAGTECQPSVPCLSNVPVRVSTLSNVTRISGTGGGGYALRADGTVWTWGSDYFGSLGNDSVTGHTSVPVPVVGLSGVSGIGGGSSAGYAIVPNP